ncbi:MAG: ElyC/SanA/YdcF family protein [Patescibacteria group bacterium]
MKFKNPLIKNLIIAIIVFILTTLMLVIICDLIIDYQTQNSLFDNIENIESKKIGLSLGTSKYVSDGRQNLFYIYRLNAAEELYKNNKIKFILISGDNSVSNYNEPQTMKDDLISRGVPEERIYLDYAGFDTWDSIIRSNKVFLENDIIIISQKFHNQRAVYIAQQNNIEAIGFNAQEVPVRISPRVWLRERLARVKVFWNIIINKQPKFLGETINIQ